MAAAGCAPGGTDPDSSHRLRLPDEAPMKLNLGCGELLLSGYINIDKYVPKADVQADVFELEYPPASMSEIRMHHLLEHLAIAEGPKLLSLCYYWMRPGGSLIVEVPDMAELMANPGSNWLTDIYGVQSTEGEFHKAGFTKDSLLNAIMFAGFMPEGIHSFRSTHPYRPGFPCLEVVAYR